MPVATERRIFSRTELLSREELEALQLRRLKTLLARTWATNGFYRDHWRRAGVCPDDVQTLDDFRNRVPFVQKQDCLADQEETPPLGRRLGVPLEVVRHVHMTSGSSGIGQEAWGLTQADLEWSGTGVARTLHWSGTINRGDFSFQLLPTFFTAGHCFMQSMRKLGVSVFETAGIDKAIVEGLAGRFDVTFWPTPGVQFYGCTQAGGMAASACEHGVAGAEPPLVHFHEDHFIVECLDRETGRQAEPGDDCEIFLTSLSREASPCIRFRMHDKLQYLSSAECACGRPFHGYRAGTIDRWDDMMKVKGINLWPLTMDKVIFGVPGIRDYRGEVFLDERKRDQMRIVVDFTDAGLAPDKVQAMLEDLKGHVKAQTFVTPLVEQAPGAIPDGGPKVRRWTDRRKGQR